VDTSPEIKGAKSQNFSGMVSTILDSGIEKPIGKISAFKKIFKKEQRKNKKICFIKDKLTSDKTI